MVISLKQQCDKRIPFLQSYHHGFNNSSEKFKHGSRCSMKLISFIFDHFYSVTQCSSQIKIFYALWSHTQQPFSKSLHLTNSLSSFETQLRRVYLNFPHRMTHFLPCPSTFVCPYYLLSHGTEYTSASPIGSSETVLFICWSPLSDTW